MKSKSIFVAGVPVFIVELFFAVILYGWRKNVKTKSFATCFLIVLFAAVTIISVRGAGADLPQEAVRVAVAVSGKSLEFAADSEYRIIDQLNGKQIAQTNNNKHWLVEMKDGRIFLQCDGKTYGPYNGPVTVREDGLQVSVRGGQDSFLDGAAAGELTAVNAAGKTVSLVERDSIQVKSALSTKELAAANGTSLLTLVTDGQSRRYRGDMSFMVENGDLLAINQLNIEDYLRGVIAAEMYPSWPAEALKAQAVVSRNYALQKARESKGASYDLTADQYSQVYKGYDGEVSTTNQAVEDTAGQVMLNRGSLIPAFFHSSSGGYTENSEDVWLTSLPSVKTKKDPYDRNDDHYNWQVDYSVSQLLDKLKKEGSFKDISDLKLAYTASGARVKEMTVLGTSADGTPLQAKIANADRVRTVLGLKSALFTMEKIYDKDKKLSGVRLNGSGFGHGLGMPQYGARGMAQQGYNYQEILQYYYTDIIITTNYGV